MKRLLIVSLLILGGCSLPKVVKVATFKVNGFSAKCIGGVVYYDRKEAMKGK